MKWVTYFGRAEHSLREKCSYSEFFWSTFSSIWTEWERYGVFLCIQSKCGKYGPEKLQIRTLFTQWLRQFSNYSIVCIISNSLQGKKSIQIFWCSNLGLCYFWIAFLHHFLFLQGKAIDCNTTKIQFSIVIL